MKLRIEPSEGPSTKGTKVYLDDKEITGIRGLNLDCHVNGAWECTLDMYVTVEGFQVDTTVIANETRVYRKASRWELIKALFRPMFHG